MRDELVGYVLDALEPHEKAAFEAQLANDAKLLREVEIVRHALAILECNRGHCDPPPGLAHRTCQFVALQITTMSAPAAPSASRWRMADLVVAAGIFLAASALFFPAVYQSRYASQLAGCQNNLRRIGQALADYSGLHNGYFPELAGNGQFGAGVYAAKLLDHGLLNNPQWVVCPATPLAKDAHRFRVPTLKQLESASAEELAELERSMGGSYGYNLGYADDEGYHSTKNLGRSKFALMADAPVGDTAHPFSLNHGTPGQNVLFEDGHVAHLLNCNADGCEDNIFLNDRGQLAPGTHLNDAVIGSSSVRPQLLPVSNTR